MHELDFITIRGFKSIAACNELKLAPINIAIGANGAGKSNFIEVFSFLHAIREGNLQDYVGKAGGADKLLHFGSKVTPKLFMHISFKEGCNQFDITLEPTDDDELIPTDETWYYWDKAHYAQPYLTRVQRKGKEAGISIEKETGVASFVRSHLVRWRLYHVHDTSRSSPMRKTCDLHDNEFLRPDGSNLAAFLFCLQEQHSTEYKLIRKTVQRVAPFFDDFNLKPSKLNEDKIRLEWKHGVRCLMRG